MPNSYVIDLYKDNPSTFYPIGSIHPYRKDCVEELIKCANNGITIIKWLPNSQGINPASDLCIPFYKKMAELDIILLTHTGEEHSVNIAYLNNAYGNPLLLRTPLDLGVKIIAAHVASEGLNVDFESPNKKKIPNYDLLIRLMKEDKYKSLLFADISAISGFKRIPFVPSMLSSTYLHSNFIYGSDYPIPAINVVVNMKKIVNQRLITEAQAECLREIYHFNPLLFDFCLKRCFTGPNGERFPTSLFKQHPKLPPIRIIH